MIYLFSSANSFNSILTIDKKSKKNGSDSIFEVAKEAGLDKVILVEKNPSSFPQALKNSKEAGLQLVYGLKLTVCEESDDKSLNSVPTEHKLVFLANTGQAYKNCLMQLYSDAATRGSYEGTPRTDFKRIKEFWGDEMTMIVPFYGNFLYNNLMNFSSCMPNFEGFSPYFAIEFHDLPFDGFMAKKIREYAKGNMHETLDCHSVYYKNKEDFLPYMVFKCIQNKSDIEVPNLNNFCSKEFYLKG